MQREDIAAEKNHLKFSPLNLQTQVHEPTFPPSFLPLERRSATSSASKLTSFNFLTNLPHLLSPVSSVSLSLSELSQQHWNNVF